MCISICAATPTLTPSILCAYFTILSIHFHTSPTIHFQACYLPANNPTRLTSVNSQYSKVAHYNTTHIRRQNFYALPQSHWQRLAAPPISYLATLDAVDDAIDENAELATAILQCALQSFGGELAGWQGTATSSDLEKARSTLRQFWRDWSVLGSEERKVCFEPLVRDLQTERRSRSDDMDDDDGERAKLKVLVPGAGLGRLVFDLCLAGFEVEGNEISYHQLLASSYILNASPAADCHTIYPWIHSFSNHRTRSNHLQSVTIPDIHPGTAISEHQQQYQQLRQSNTGREHVPDKTSEETTREPGTMSMSASDFLLLYNAPEYTDSFDAIATCFFIDTAPNPIRYIETVHNCLKPGGIWTNLGPLLWHFEGNAPGSPGGDEMATRRDGGGLAGTSMTDGNGDCGIADPGSVELTDDELLALLEMSGFCVEIREGGMEAGYISDRESMLQSTYRVSHWVARKL